ncbi:MAG TPA: hypothetical protein VGR59_04205 [Gemmatimonadaceae bacterium]|nr:hypothetical protein [Gemmatimonadaceae bacterium]
MSSAALRNEFPPAPRPFSPHVPNVHVQPPFVFVQAEWGYREVVRHLDETGAMTEADLNALGAEGWELAGILQDGRSVRYYLKRQLR